MSADRTPLEPPPAESNCLERPSRKPDRREEVALEAPHDNIATHGVAATPNDEGPHNEQHNNDDREEEGYRRGRWHRSEYLAATPQTVPPGVGGHRAQAADHRVRRAFDTVGEHLEALRCRG